MQRRLQCRAGPSGHAEMHVWQITDRAFPMTEGQPAIASHLQHFPVVWYPVSGSHRLIRSLREPERECPELEPKAIAQWQDKISEGIWGRYKSHRPRSYFLCLPDILLNCVAGSLLLLLLSSLSLLLRPSSSSCSILFSFLFLSLSFSSP